MNGVLEWLLLFSIHKLLKNFTDQNKKKKLF